MLFLLETTVHKNMRGITRLGRNLNRFTYKGVLNYSLRLIGRAKRNLGKVRKPRPQKLWGPTGRDMGLFNLAKRPKSKKTPAIWKRGSWLHKWIDKEDINGRRSKEPLFHVGVRGGWKPASILEHGGSERVWGQVFYTRKPYEKKTRRKTKAAGTSRFTPRGRPKLITSHKKRKIFGNGRGITPLRVTVKTPPFRLMVRSAKQTERQFMTEMTRALRRGIKESRV